MILFDEKNKNKNTLWDNNMTKDVSLSVYAW